MKYFTLFFSALFVSLPALAQETPPPSVGMQDQLIMLVFIVLIFYFLVIRPQSKKFKQHQDMVASLKRGDKVVTGGGIEGKIARILEDGRAVVEIAPNVEVTVVKSTVTELVSRTEPASDKKATAKADGQKTQAKKK